METTTQTASGTSTRKLKTLAADAGECSSPITPNLRRTLFFYSAAACSSPPLPSHAPGPRDVTPPPSSSTLQVKTIKNGYNSGRSYYIRMTTAAECQETIDTLSRLARAAKVRAEQRTRFERNQLQVRRALIGERNEGNEGYMQGIGSLRE